MKLLKSATIALGVLLATASSAYARDFYNVGIIVGNYGHPAAYSSNYSVGHSNHYYAYPNVVYYGAPVVRYEPVVHYQPVVRHVPMHGYGGQHFYGGGHHGYRGNHGFRGNNQRWQGRHHGRGHR